MSALVLRKTPNEELVDKEGGNQNILWKRLTGLRKEKRNIQVDAVRNGAAGLLIKAFYFGDSTIAEKKKSCCYKIVNNELEKSFAE